MAPSLLLQVKALADVQPRETPTDQTHQKPGCWQSSVKKHVLHTQRYRSSSAANAASPVCRQGAEPSIGPVLQTGRFPNNFFGVLGNIVCCVHVIWDLPSWKDLKLLSLPGGCGREAVLPEGDNLTCAGVRRDLVGTAEDWELLMGL